MKRVVVLGRGGAGKSIAAVRLGEITGLPVIELDKYFWQPGLLPTPKAKWKQIQYKLASRNKWIMDGDLGPYDALSIRLKEADTVLILDFSFIRCFWRAMRRSRERFNFWWWTFTWRRRSRPQIMHTVSVYAKGANVHILRTPRALEQFLSSLEAGKNNA